MKNLAIIPARGGSKRIPKKNIQELNGTPLLAYSIEFALKSHFFDHVIVSTENEEIAEIAKQNGAEVPFIRPTELATDDVPDKPVIDHCLTWLKQNSMYQPDLVWYLKPTSPLRNKEDLQAIAELFNKNNPDSVRSVSKVEGTNHPYWMYKKSENGFAQPLIEGVTIEEFYQSQLLPPVYKLNGVYEVIAYKTLIQSKTLYGRRMMLYETNSRYAIDIDEQEDFLKAERLIKEFSHD